MSEPILQLIDVSKAFFGVHAVRNVNLDVGTGQILALIGQNGAGKSTLMNIVGGVVEADSGSMRLAGADYRPRNPADATKPGIAFIHQELNLFSNLSIAENVFIDAFPHRSFGPVKLIDQPAMLERTRKLLAEVTLDLDPNMLVERLSPGERQLVEVAKALHREARIIIFDEPTTSLTQRETDRLFELIARLRQSGTSMIYISHILGDVLRLADTIAILRDGELVTSGPKAMFDVGGMITEMIGRPIDRLFPPRTSAPGSEILLSTRGLTAKGTLRAIDLELKRGEVLGIFGLMGSGRSELARTIFGLDPYDSGDVVIRDRKTHSQTPQRSIRNGVAFITENRREEGLMMNVSIAENIGLAALRRFSATPLQIVERNRLAGAVGAAREALQIKARSVGQPAKSLSGGNQQKVVIAKWLLSQPSIFIMDEPTRGIDVGAKYEIYTIIDRIAAEGGGVLFISSEIEELLAMCDRLLVMSKGEIVGTFGRDEFDKEQVLRAAFREHPAAA